MYVGYHAIRHGFSISPRVNSKALTGLCKVLHCLAHCVAPEPSLSLAHCTWAPLTCSWFWPPQGGCCLQDFGLAAPSVWKALDPDICVEHSLPPSSPCSNVTFSVRARRTILGETAAYLHPPKSPSLLYFLHSSHHLLTYSSNVTFTLFSLSCCWNAKVTSAGPWLFCHCSISHA